MKWIKASEANLPKLNKGVNGKFKNRPAIVCNTNLVKGYITVNGNLERIEDDIYWLNETPAHREWSKAEIIQKIKEKWIAEFGDLNRNIDSEPPNGYFVAGFVSTVLDEIESTTPEHSGDELLKDHLYKLFLECEHGDEQHRQWLKDKFNDYLKRASE